MTRYVLLAVAVLSACGENGVRAPAEERVWHGTEELVIRENFGRIQHLLVNDSGWIIIPDQQIPALRVHAPDGSRGTTIGRSGRGPGEFQVITQVGWRGDTAWVYDPRLRRISIISPELEVARTVDVPDFPRSLTIGGVEARTGSPIVLAAPDDSHWIVMLHPRPPGASQAALPGVVYARLGPAQSMDKLIAHHESSRSSYFASVPGFTGGGEYPFAIDPIYEVADDASRSVLVQVFFDHPEAPELTVAMFDAAGDTIYARSYPLEGEPIPRQVRDSALDAGAQWLPAEAAAQYRKDPYVPPIYPPIKGAAIAEDGALWIWLRPRNLDEERYLMLDPDGSPVGEVTFPRGTQVEVIRGDTVWAIVKDDLDVQTVARFSVGE